MDLEGQGSHGELIEVKFRDKSVKNKTVFSNKISSFPWHNLKSDDPNEYTESFLAKINEIYCKSFPMKIKTVSKKYFCNPRITPSIRKLINSKSKYFELLKLKLITIQENNTFRNHVNKIVKK